MKAAQSGSILYVYLPLGQGIKIFPLGIASLAHYIHRTLPGVTQQILDLSVIEKNQRRRRLGEAIRGFKPALIAFSWRHIRCFGTERYNNGVSYLLNGSSLKGKLELLRKGFSVWKEYAGVFALNKRYIRYAKKISAGATIALGGSAFSIFYKDLLAQLPEGVIGITGEGEKALFELASGRGLASGRFVQRKGRMILGDTAIKGQDSAFEAHKELSAIDHNYIRDIFPDYAHYYGQPISVETNRGCAQRCIYCPDSARDKTKVAVRNPHEVVEEIIKVKDVFKTEKIWFPDRLVVSQQSAATFSAVLERLVEKQISIRWSGYMRPDCFDDKLAHLIVRSGLDNFIISITSGSQRVIDHLKLGFDIAAVLRGCRLLKEAGFNGSIDVEFTFGVIEETAKDIQKSVTVYNEIRKIFHGQSVRPVINLCSVLPGAELEEELIREGHLPREYNTVSTNPLLLKKLIYMHPKTRIFLKDIYTAFNPDKETVGN